jgi:sulfatase maturation enzyme AslB (radical SAM superfamily)
MECKFLTNGLALQYHNFLKPCCDWQADDQWVKEHNISKVNLINWHQHPELVKARSDLAQDIWPQGCSVCEKIESQGRQDSMRYNGFSAYGEYGVDDITLEIRPGNVCNFACQTCWTPASTRVADFYKKAQIPDIYSNFIKNDFVDYNFLDSIAHRLKSIVVLGGEPFYDPKCLEFLSWCKDHTQANILTFTNGSCLDFDLMAQFKEKFTLVFSLDAVGLPAEYIRFGTEWDKVMENFQTAQKLPNVEVRVNITTSVYNFYYLSDVIDLLIPNWPSVVSFGLATDDIYSERVIPIDQRQQIIDRLQSCILNLTTANIESGQKSNALNAVQSIIDNLNDAAYDKDLHEQFKTFVSKMDSVKKAKLQDFCPEISRLVI